MLSLKRTNEVNMNISLEQDVLWDRAGDLLDFCEESLTASSVQIAEIVYAALIS